MSNVFRRFNKVIESNIEPSNKNDIWLNKGRFCIYYKGEWAPITLNLEDASNVLNFIESNIDFIIAEIEKRTQDYAKKEDIAEEYAKKTDVADGLRNKVDKVAGKGLSTYDFNDFRIKQIERANNEPIWIGWEELKDLRDNNELIEGRLYHITDFVTTTTKENTQSAGHMFDIIVLALDNHTLAEEAWASASEFNLENYKDAYSGTLGERMIYIGTFEYNSKIYHRYESESGDIQMLADFTERLYFTPDSEYCYQFNPSWTRMNVDNNEWEEWMDGEEFGESLEYKVSPNVSYFADNGANLSAWKIWYSLDNNRERFAWADEENGKGVIYRMIDEWGNDCPYDFKNIQFKRGIYASGEGIAKEEGDEDYKVFCYTFSWEDEEQVIMDASIFGNNGYLLNDEGQINGVYGNTIKSYIDYTAEFKNPSVVQQHLNNIVFLSTFGYDSGTFYGYYGNNLDNNCKDNSFGNNCYNNSFGNQCRYNSFGNECYNNSFSNDCSFNSFGKRCYNNSFGNHCQDNSFETDCTNNTLDDYCTSITFCAESECNSIGKNGHNISLLKPPAGENKPSNVNIESQVRNITLRYTGVSANAKYPKIKILNGVSNVELDMEPDNPNMTIGIYNLDGEYRTFLLEDLITKLIEL